MTADYYIRDLSEEWEVVERWENEGGRVRQYEEANYVARQTQVAGGGQIKAEAIAGV